MLKRSSSSPLLLFSFLALCLHGAWPHTAHADLIVSEVVTDPQGDHSENAGGNGVPYDDIPGTGTVSAVDEFVELFNTGGTLLDLRGVSLLMDDTSPRTHVFGTTTSGLVRFSAGSSLHALLPGGVVLLGNPTGSLNNRLSLVLLGIDGSEWDRWVIDDANATGPANESVHRVFVEGVAQPLGERGVISPLVVLGFDGSPSGPSGPSDPSDPTAGGGGGSGGAPVPEPSTLYLVIAGGVLFETRRRARCASRQKQRATPRLRRGSRRTALTTQEHRPRRGAAAETK